MTGLVSLLVVLVCALAGAQLLRWGRVESGGALERWVLGAALGLGVLAYAVQGLGLLGFLSPGALAALLALLLLGGLFALPSLLRETGAEFLRWLRGRWGAGQWLAVALLAPAATLAVLTLGGALAPPGDLDYDSLAYHLAIPKLYLEAGRIFYVDHIWHANIPFTCQMWYTVGLAFAEHGGAKVFHWASGLLTALAAAAWTARWTRGADGRPSPAWAPALAALAFLSIPVGVWEATTAYIDLGTALYLTVALYCLCRAFAPGVGTLGCSNVQTSAGEALRWALLAGAFAGWAAGTKYSPLLQMGLMGAGALAVAAYRRDRLSFQLAAAFALAAGLIAAPWYARNYVWTGNPVYPFYTRLFPQTRNWNLEATLAIEVDQQGFGRAQGAEAMVRALWDTAFHGRDFFLAAAPIRTLVHDKFFGLGIVFAALLPLLVLARNFDRRWLALVLFLLASLAGWVLTSQQSRYLLPVFGVAAVLVGLTAAGLPWRSLRAGAVAVVLVQSAGAAWGTFALTHDAWRLLAGRIDQRQYLEAYLPDLYEASLATGTLRQGARIALYHEMRGFYLQRDYLRANPLHHDLIPYDTLPDGDALADFLRDEQGITHVLLNQQFVDAPTLEQHWFQLLVEMRRQGRLGVVWRSQRARTLDEDVLALTAAYGAEWLGAAVRERQQAGLVGGRGIVIYSLQ